MKITKDIPPKQFYPVAIILESPDEIEILRHLCGCWDNQSNCSSREKVREFSRIIGNQLRQI